MKNPFNKLASRLFGRAKENDSVDRNFDDFYIEFENQFRGSEAEIKNRLKVYLPYLRKASKSGLPALDIGCGRGELLQLLNEQGIDSKGVDLSPRMVEQARKKGLDVVDTDALDFISKQPDSSFAAITAIHILEHLPFETVFSLARDCLRGVAPGGYVIFETPNPESLVVGSNTFYNDPSHLRPIPPKLLEFLLQYLGFRDVKTHYFRPAKRTPNTSRGITKSLAENVFGPTDYAVIGRKPADVS